MSPSRDKTDIRSATVTWISDLDTVSCQYLILLSFHHHLYETIDEKCVGAAEKRFWRGNRSVPF